MPARHRWKWGYCLLLSALVPLACGGHSRTEGTDAAAQARSAVTATGAGSGPAGGPIDLGSAPPTAEVGSLPGELRVDGAGHATYEIALEVAPGSRGMQPSLALSYNSGSGNGLVGVGFGLSGLSLISRCSRTLADDGQVAPLSFGEDDPLCLDGQRLARIAGTPGQDGAEYQPRVGAISRRVIGHGSIATTESWFEVRLPDGNVARYGSVDEARLIQVAPIADATQVPQRVREWWIRSVTDPYGNEVRYRYGHTTQNGTRTNFRPARVEYGFVAGVATRTVGFGYELRPDPIMGYVRGAPTALDWRLSQIAVAGPEGVVRRYRLGYFENPEFGDPEMSISGRSLLRSVKECTADERCKPETAFAWEMGTPGYESTGGGLSSESVPKSSQGTPHHDVATYVAVSERQLMVAPQPRAGDGRTLSSDHWETWGAGLDPDPQPFNIKHVVRMPHWVWQGSGNSLHIRYYDDGLNLAGAYAVQANNDEHADLLYIQRESDDVQDDNGWGPFAGSRVILIKGRALGEATWQPEVASEQLNLGLPDRPFLQFVPTDVDGNGLTDYVYCMADEAPPAIVNGCLNGYPGPGGGDGACSKVLRLPQGHWYLGKSPSGGYLTNTQLGDAICDANDQINVVDWNGDGIQDVLVVSARYQAGESSAMPPGTRKTPAQWGSYRAMRLSGNGELLGWDDTGLPSDRFQRFMMGALADVERGDLGFDNEGIPLVDLSSPSGTVANPLDPEDQTRVPFRSGGLGMDKVADVNGDGLPDIVRLELRLSADQDNEIGEAEGDGAAMLPAIRHAADPHEGMVSWTDLGARVWLNTGAGFVKDSAVWMSGWSGHDAQPGSFLANAALFSASVVLDSNGNGTADLLIPTADGATWEADDYLELKKLHAALPYQFPMGIETKVGFKAFRPGPTMDLDRDGQHDFVVLSSPDTVTNQWSAFRHRGKTPDLLVNVRNGMGHDTQVDYLPTSDLAVYTDDTLPAVYPTTRVGAGTRPVVRKVRSETAAYNQPDDPYREVSYSYHNARADRRGRGFLGFGLTRTDQVFAAKGYHTSTVTKLHDAVWESWIEDYPTRAFVDWSVTRTNGMSADATGAVVSPSAHVEVRSQGALGHKLHLTGPMGYAPYAQVDQIMEYEFPAAAGSPCSVDQGCEIGDLDGKTPLRGSIRVVDEADLDDFEYPTRETTQELAQAVLSTVTVERTFEHRANAAQWQLGLLKEEVLTEILPNAGVTVLTRQMDYLATGALWHATREPESQDPAIYLRSTYTYDVHGQPVSAMTMDLGGNFRFEVMSWDSDGVFPATQSNMLGHTTSFLSWNRGLGVPLQVQAPNGEVSARQVDGFGRPIAEQSFKNGLPLGPKTTTSYELLGSFADPLELLQVKVHSTTEGEGGSESIHDPLGRVTLAQTESFDGGLTSVITRYGHFGELVNRSIPYKTPDLAPAAWTSYSYDGRGRVRSVTLPDGTHEHWRHAPLATWHEDAKGNWSREVVDERGQLTRTLHGMPSATHAPGRGDDPSELCFYHGPLGRLDASGPCAIERATSAEPWTGPSLTVMGYDDLLRKTWLQDDALGARSYAYDAFGNMVSSTDAKGQTITIHHDVLGRPDWRLSPDGTATWTWDTLRLGALSHSESETGNQEDAAYDSMGRLASMTHTVHGQAYTFHYAYDNLGRLDTLTYPTSLDQPAFRVQNVYNPHGYLESVRNADSLALFWQQDEVDAAGHTTREHFGNELVTARTFDPITGRLENIETRRGLELPIQWNSYDWEPNGHLKERDDWVHGQVERFFYDVKDRLTSVETCVNGCGTKSFTYDPWGNLTSKSGVGAYVYAGQRLSWAGPIHYTYDGNGNVATRTLGLESSFAYTALNKPRHISAADGDELDFDYNAVHRRVYRSSELTETETISLGLYERELVGSGKSQVRIDRYSVQGAGRVVAQVMRTEDPNLPPTMETLYLHDDHLGSTEVITGDFAANEPVAIAERLSFDTWGAKRDPQDWSQAIAGPNASGVTLGFTGHTDRLDAGLVHMGGRMYDPLAARFTQADPFVQAAEDMRSHNRFSYAWSSPATLTDPSGYVADAPEWGGGGFVLPGFLGLIVGGIEWCIQNCGSVSIQNGSSGAAARSSAQDVVAAPAAPTPAVVPTTFAGVGAPEHVVFGDEDALVFKPTRDLLAIEVDPDQQYEAPGPIDLDAFFQERRDQLGERVFWTYWGLAEQRFPWMALFRERTQAEVAAQAERKASLDACLSNSDMVACQGAADSFEIKSGRGFSGGGKTGRKANPDRVRSASVNLDRLKGELRDLKSSPNKTAEIHKQIEAIEKAIKRESSRLKKSESHAQKGQGHR